MDSRSLFMQNLVDEGILPALEADRLFAEHKGREVEIARLLHAQADGAQLKARIGRLYGDFVGLAHIQLTRTLFQPEALRRIDADSAASLRCMPIYILNDTLTVAVADPDDRRNLAEIEKRARIPISPVFAFPSEILNAIEVNYETTDAMKALAETIEAEHGQGEDEVDPARIEELGGSANVVKLVRSILLYGMKYDASDIHIQPTENAIRLRYRIDGVLRNVLDLPKWHERPIASRLKIMADLDIAERRLPQDGRVELELKNRSQGFRFSSIPTVVGEKLVLRAVGDAANNSIANLDEIGLSQRNQHLLEVLVRRPNGIVFVTGPTGSGKTTTLYSVLAELHKPDVNIVTVEDPVEFRMDGITQVQTHTQIGLTFAAALRSILRQDPDIVLIGEIRDLETAKIAAEAALTGHLVLATMHTNSAAQAVTRLIEIGVEPFLVAPSLVGVIGQRLVRRICESCKVEYTPDRAVLEANFYNLPDELPTFHRGQGCKECHGTGYAGRIAIHEILPMSDATRKLIATDATVMDLEETVRESGFRSLRYDGFLKVLQGITTIDEVNRVTEEALA